MGYKHPIPFNIYSFIHIVKNYYDLPDVITYRVEHIMKQVYNNYHKYFSNIPYETVVLGIVLFSTEEFYKRKTYSTPPIDIKNYIILLYGEDNLQYHVTQVYYVKSVVENTFI